jgi:TIR domain
MADVFVSYAKTDRPLASKLVAMLEAEGWSVWWDTSLGAADLYRDEIMKQLVSARAVIAIWTPNSIRSDWVRAEAGAAKKDGKLIPVKTVDVAYPDIPLPFGEMHTENLEAAPLIRAAVVAQLHKPAVEPTAWALLTKGFRYELLTWVGIVGGALTLFGNLDAVLKLADWARVLVDHWKEWTHAFWLWAFSWLGIHLPPGWTPLLSFLLFGSLLTIGQAVQFQRTKNQSIVDKYRSKSFQLISWRMLLCILVISVGFFGWGAVLVEFFSIRYEEQLLGVIFFVPPLAIPVIMFARHKLYAAVTVSLMGVFWGIITFNQLLTVRSEQEVVYATWVTYVSVMVIPLILLSVAPAKAITRRLIFLAIALLLLIALNELSKFGLDVTAPKHG